MSQSPKAIDLAKAARALRAFDDAPELRDAQIDFVVDDILQSSLPPASFAVRYVAHQPRRLRMALALIRARSIRSRCVLLLPVRPCPTSRFSHGRSHASCDLVYASSFAVCICTLTWSQGYFFILSCNHDLSELTDLMLPAGLSLHRDLSSQVTMVDSDLALLCFTKPV